MMADNIHEPTTTQSIASSIPPYTQRVTSTFADTASQYDQTSVFSPERPRYQDLPPSYVSASGDARNSGMVMSFGPLGTHRIDTDESLGDNEWQNEPSILDYRMRGQGIELSPAREEEQVSDDDHADTQIIIVRRADIMTLFPSAPSRAAAIVQDPPRSLPGALSSATSEGRRGRHARGPFGRVGRRMGSWGQQIGRQVGAIGNQFGQSIERWASAYSTGGGGYNPPVRPTRAVRPSTAEPNGPPQYEHPPSYEDAQAYA